ncbi:MAG: CxxH/CxxC protein [Bacteroidota bacterium]
MYAVCADHLETAIDDFLEAYGAPPDVHLFRATPFTGWTPPPRCHYCREEPIYLVI